MANKRLFSYKIEPMNYMTQQGDIVLTPNFDSDAIDQIVLQKLSEMNLKVNSIINYIIKDGFLVAEGMAYEISEFNFGFL